MTYTLNNRKLLTKKQAEAVIHHLKRDMDFGTQGSFVKDETDKNGDYLLDTKDIGLVQEAIRRIESYLTQD